MMARVAHALVLAVLLLAAGPAHAQLGPNGEDPAGIVSGLNLVQSNNGSGAFSGRTLSDSSATGPTGLLNDYQDSTDDWAEDFTVVDMSGDTLNGVANAVVINSKVTDTIMRNYLWLADTNGQTVYKVSTASATSGDVLAAYRSKPATAAGNPVAFAVLSNGDAFVGNAFTFGGSEVGSLAKIQADTAGNCGGTTTSSTSTPETWASGTTSPDGCVKAWTSLGDSDVSIAAIGADGADNVYTIAVNEDTKFDGFLRLYVTDKTGAGPTTLLASYKDSGRTIGTNVLADTDGPGAPGGSSLLVDKWGYLWSGGGTYVKDFGAGGRKYILIRYDTNNPTSVVQIFAVDHETQALAFDNDGNLWVSGAGGMSLLNIDPNDIGLMTATPDTIGTTIVLESIDLLGAQGDTCGGDTCCEEGNYNTGITVSRANGDVYVANECPAGKVLVFSKTGVQVGAVIDVGTYPSAISVDALNKVWVSILVTSGVEGSEVRGTELVKLAPGADPVTTDKTAIAVPFLGATGDITGRYTAQPPATGTWEWIHDTTYNNYDKWNGAKARWTGTNATDAAADPLIVITASSSNTGSVWFGADDIATGSGVTYSSMTLPAGRYVRFQATVTRDVKKAPETGPQAFGISPLLTKFEIIPRNNNPIALCRERTVDADEPTNQADNTYGSNINGRVCGALLDSTTAVDDASHDGDTAELDSIIEIQPTAAFYSPQKYPLLDQTDYTSNTLTVTDAHGGSDTCSADVVIVDQQPPVWKSQFSKNNVTASAAASDIEALCIWPPNFKYFCWLDVLSPQNDQVIPLYDNCGGSVAIGKRLEGFVCEDSDPRSKAGDCVVYQDGSKYNLCVKAQRRTTYTNTARVYQANFKVTDASRPTVGDLPADPEYARSIRIPPLWNFQTSGSCPRPTYKAPAGPQGQVYINAARK